MEDEFRVVDSDGEIHTLFMGDGSRAKAERLAQELSDTFPHWFDVRDWRGGIVWTSNWRRTA